jgi:hypothetical protein
MVNVYMKAQLFGVGLETVRIFGDMSDLHYCRRDDF